jgi:tetratricopeptide (TPR) repeat protein
MVAALLVSFSACANGGNAGNAGANPAPGNGAAANGGNAGANPAAGNGAAANGGNAGDAAANNGAANGGAGNNAAPAANPSSGAKSGAVGGKYAGFEGYDASFMLAVGRSGSWAPFGTGTGFDWTNGDGSVANASASGSVMTFAALGKGETVMTATLDGVTRRALVVVLPAPALDSPDGWTEWYADIILDDLEGMDALDQVEYLLTIGDYMALSQAVGGYTGEFLSMAEAATILYPCEYLLNNYATLLMNDWEYAEALIWLEKAAEAGTNNPMVLTNIAECHYRLGNTTSAMDYAARALGAEPDYGLAYLVMTCVHLKNGNDILAMETLFKSMKTVWTERSYELCANLLERVWEAASYDEMPITPFHLDLLGDAVAAGCVPDGRDVPENQISVPFPVGVAGCLTEGESWEATMIAIKSEIDAEFTPYMNSTFYPMYDGNARQGFCIMFLSAYYEFLIKQAAEYMKVDSYRGLGGESVEDVLEYNPHRDRLMPYATEINTLNDAFDRRYRELEQAIRDEMDELEAKAQKLSDELFVMGVVDPMASVITGGGGTDEAAWTAEVKKRSEELLALIEYMPIRELELKIAMYDELHPLWQQLLVNKAFATDRVYEDLMRPLLEEYWLKLNAMLGYVSGKRYEYPALHQINMQAFVNPLDMVSYEWETVNHYRIEANRLRGQLQQALQGVEARQEAKERAEILQKVVEQQQREVKQKETWGEDAYLTLPLLPGMAYVKFGVEGSKLVAGYGGLGTEILHGWDPATGVTSETVTHRTSIILDGIPDLAVSGWNNLTTLRESMAVDAASGIGRVSGSKLLSNIPSIKGQIPAFDITRGEGRTTTFDRKGNVIDVTTFKDQTGAYNLGFWGVSRSKAVYSHDGLVTSRVERHIDVSFGPLSGRIK